MPDRRNGRAPDSGAETEQPAIAAVHVVLGDPEPGRERSSTLRHLPRIERGAGESEGAHLRRVVARLLEAMAQGGTHFVVPQRVAGWLEAHPLIEAYLIENHDLVEASAASGIVFALRNQENHAYALEVSGWQVLPGEELILQATERLTNPKTTLRLRQPVPGPLTGRVVLAARGLRTIRLRCVASRPGRRAEKSREVALSLVRPGFVFHSLPFFEAVFQQDGSVALEFDIKLSRARTLSRVDIELVEEDNWRVHPTFPGGESLALPATARTGAWLQIKEFSLQPAPRVRKGPPFGSVRGIQHEPYRKPAGKARDAVIFSSWIPKQGLVLGDYFLEALRRWHADSKIFVGVNHGSEPEWLERLRDSGLDVTVAPATPDLTMPFDPTGFVAALAAYRRHQEPFDLVWFGHNKGGDHLADRQYATGRWMIERMFWSRRAEIERFFDDPIVGLYAPHYLMLLQEHLTQTDALCRMYDAPCTPLYAMAVSAHFVMRDQSVRDFCARVDRQFFRYGPEPFGGDRFFFEMAMPNVPIMQGYEPFIEPGLGGTGIHPKITGVESILNDWRQNHAVVAFELEKWRQDPTSFRTRHREHTRVD